MKKALRDRFYFGNTEWPSFLSPEAELFYKSPRRQEQLIKLAYAQIQMQRDAVGEIRVSSIQAAEVVAAEIEEQTTRFNNQLQSSINELGNTVERAFQEATESLTDEISKAANRICADLTEIKWQLSQQQETLAGIWRLLYESRSNEARQLVNQGVRHYLNNEIPEAKERFLRALDFDTTDYQVLMNLGFISLEHDEFDVAVRYFNKALNLPTKLNSKMKVVALNALARLYYSNHDFIAALAHAEESVRQNQWKDPEDIFKVAIYAYLVGKAELSIRNIERAINMDSFYFSKAAVEPDLAGLRREIISLLSRISAQAKKNAQEELEKTADVMNKCDSGEYPETKGFFVQISEHYKRAEQLAEHGSYSSLRGLPAQLKKLREAKEGNCSLRVLLDEQKKAKMAADARIKIRDEKKNMYAKDLEYPEHEVMSLTGSGFSTVALLIAFIISYVIVGIKVASTYYSTIDKYESGGNWLAGVLWPIWYIGSVFGSLFGKGYKKVASAGTSGIFLGLCIMGSLWFIVKMIDLGIKNRHEYRQGRADECWREVRVDDQEISSLSQEIAAIDTKIRGQAATIDKQIMELR
jgi:Flp pilus assembly protein TadD